MFFHCPFVVPMQARPSLPLLSFFRKIKIKFIGPQLFCPRKLYPSYTFLRLRPSYFDQTLKIYMFMRLLGWWTFSSFVLIPTGFPLLEGYQSMGSGDIKSIQQALYMGATTEINVNLIQHAYIILSNPQKVFAPQVKDLAQQPTASKRWIFSSHMYSSFLRSKDISHSSAIICVCGLGFFIFKMTGEDQMIFEIVSDFKMLLYDVWNYGLSQSAFPEQINSGISSNVQYTDKCGKGT